MAFASGDDRRPAERVVALRSSDFGASVSPSRASVCTAFWDDACRAPFPPPGGGSAVLLLSLAHCSLYGPLVDPSR